MTTKTHLEAILDTDPAAKLAHSLLVDSARNDTVLMETLVSADNMATFGLMQAEWANLVAEHPDFAEAIEFDDPYVCSLDSLAALIAQAPTSLVRQSLREVAHCRGQMDLALGLISPAAEERSQLVLAGATAEWEILLGAHPMFSAWLRVNDRFTCSRSTLIDGMLYAPCESIRHVLRETYCFRELAALATPHAFA